jgi:hypothetical protein
MLRLVCGGAIISIFIMKKSMTEEVYALNFFSAFYLSLFFYVLNFSISEKHCEIGVLIRFRNTCKQIDGITINDRK